MSIFFLSVRVTLIMKLEILFSKSEITAILANFFWCILECNTVRYFSVGILGTIKE
jgi:hypothetical protein